MDIFHKKPGLVKPGDFRRSTVLKPIFIGLLTDYRTYLHERLKQAHGIESAVADDCIHKPNLTDGLMAWRAG